MSERVSNNKIKSGSNKSFGLLFSIIFLIIALYPLIYGNNINYLCGIISIILFLISMLFPNILAIPNKLWFKLSLILGSIISPIVMAAIYLAIFTPFGVFMRLIGKDILKQKIEKKSKSYWIKKSKLVGSMRNQF